MIALAAESFLSRFFDRMGYLAPFAVLVAAGCGLPVPEEVTLLGSGFLITRDEVEFVPILLTCLLGALAGDSIPFWVGRKLGPRALRHPFLARLLQPDGNVLFTRRARRVEWVVFTCRFLPGLRLPGFFTAGTLGMSFPRFLAIDGAAACLMVPTWILIGRTFAEGIGALERDVGNVSHVLGFTLLAVVVSYVLHQLARRRGRQLASDAPPGAAERRAPTAEETPRLERCDRGSGRGHGKSG